MKSSGRLRTPQCFPASVELNGPLKRSPLLSTRMDRNLSLETRVLDTVLHQVKKHSMQRELQLAHTLSPDFVAGAGFGSG